MERGKRVEAEFRLPEVIIQHIQSFLTGKEAAQTSVLSKSWYSSWLTRPKVDFNEDDFRRERNYDTPISEKSFWKVVNKTVERYEKLNLKIDSLRLWIHGFGCESHHGCSVVNELIMKVLKMGVTCLDFKIFSGGRAFTFPHQVFELENLMSLSVSGCNITLGADGKVGCSRLKSLTLEWVHVEGDIIWDIIRSCPLIENLSLSLSLCSTVSGQYSKLGNVGTDVDGPFNKLKCLSLFGIDVHTLFFHDLSSKFPCLKDLSVHDCCGYKGIKIFSPSLECISFSHDKTLRVKFDVPSIRKFTFSGPIPSLSFKTTTSNWESYISIICTRAPNATYILKLNKLLTKLSLSRVSLTFQMCFRKRFDCAQGIKSLPKPEVENLKIEEGFHYDYTNYTDLFGALFRCCRPIYVTRPDYEMGTSDFMEYVYKRVKQEVSSKCCSTSQTMSGESDLEEVDVEIFDEAVSAWRPQLSDASTSLEAGASNWESEISIMHYYCPSSNWFLCSRRDFEEVNVDSFDEAISAWGQFSVSCVNKAKRDEPLACIGASITGIDAVEKNIKIGQLHAPLACMGASVTGIDAVEKNIKIGQLHALFDSRRNCYCLTEKLLEEQRKSDAVLALEVIKHVAEPADFYKSLSASDHVWRIYSYLT